MIFQTKNKLRFFEATWGGVAVLLFILPAVECPALEWQPKEGYRMAEVHPAESGKPGFRLLDAAQTGVTFTNSLPEVRAISNNNLMNGSGVGIGDYDGDGLADIYLCNLYGPNALYRNLGGMRFEDVTAQTGVACEEMLSTGAVFADINGDRRLDLIVTSMGGPNACFLNMGGGAFKNVTEEAGLSSRLGSTSIALADADGDGDLDLYITNYGATSILRSGGNLNITYRNGEPVVRGRYADRIKFVEGKMYELGEEDYFYLNDGTGHFVRQSWTDGTFLDENGHRFSEAPMDQGLSVVFRDMNQDGHPDIYVANDAFTPDRCYLNDGTGKFREIDPLAIRKTSYFTMGLDFADIDRDGIDDFILVDMLSTQHELVMTQQGNMSIPPKRIGELTNRSQVRRNTLFHGRGDGTFAEIANLAGVAASEWTWDAVFIDVDLDGWEDLLIPNGFMFNVDDQDTRDRIAAMGRLTVSASRRTTLLYPTLSTPNFAFRNRRDLSFEVKSSEWGFDSEAISQGMALGDFDNDGDQDVVINTLNSQALVYENTASAPRIAVRLKGRSPNTQGIGARIKVTGGPVVQTQTVMAGGRYVGGDDPIRVFAAGSITNRLSIEVTWPDGGISTVRDVPPNHYYEIDQSFSELRPENNSSEKPPEPLFTDASDLIDHTHHEDPFDDFQRQPLLPKLLSQMGPGVAWWDLNDDGHDDLIIGTGRGGKPALFLNDGKGGLNPLATDLEEASNDWTGFAGWVSSAGKKVLLGGENNYESQSPANAVMHELIWKDGEIADAPLSEVGSAGALAVADIDGDGDLDLFAAGRPVPGRYPESTPARIYRNENGKLQLDDDNTKALADAGLVNGAVFSDLNGDGLSELILACEWGPVRVFRNENGVLRETTSEMGLSEFAGWWNGVATGDFNGDGLPDIVATNWGLNDRYTDYLPNPIYLYYHENAAGFLDLFEAFVDKASGKIVPKRDLFAVGGAIPEIRARFSTHRAYAQADIQSILGDRFATANRLQANTLQSMVFINEGTRFRPVALPVEAQFAPAFGVIAADFDNDGFEDIFLSQNFFATPTEIPRLDGGRGLLLRGDGTGHFKAVPGQTSGIKVYGEQRGAAVADFNEDGRLDLVVTQNGTRTILLENRSAEPGLRVRVQGPPGNPDGIGAMLRLKGGNQSGPAREIQAGSGYWSQNNTIQVFKMPAGPAEFSIRWPGGKTQQVGIPSGARSVTLSY